VIVIYQAKLIIMKQLFDLTMFLCFSVAANAQSFTDTVFRHYKITDPELKTFEIHVAGSGDGVQKPLLVYMDGSGNFPLYYKTKSGKYSTSVPLDIKKYAKDFYVVLISKPNIPFSDTLQYSASGRRYYPENDMYRELYSLDWRAKTASKAINFLINTLPVDKKKIIVMGYSEGSQVAPAVAVINKKVTHVVCFAGNALNQLYDFIIETRLSAYINEITQEQAQKTIDSLYTEYEKIYADPVSTGKTWFGETYLKWSSFTKTTPLENMLKLNIPILYIAGSKDENQTILDMDYAKLEFLRKGKKNLTYKVYPGCDHYFQETIKSDGNKKTIDRIDEVHQFAVEWTNLH
jgi:pimeloyl-ACP methyl ester carboxylesterase